MSIFCTSASDAIHSYMKIVSIFCTSAIAEFHSYMKIMSIFCTSAIVELHSCMKIMSIFCTSATDAFHSYMKIMPIFCMLATVQSRDISHASKFFFFTRGLKSNFKVKEILPSVYTASSRASENHPVSYRMGTETFSRKQSDGGSKLTTHPNLAPMLRISRCNATPLAPTVRVTRRVQLKSKIISIKFP